MPPSALSGIVVQTFPNVLFSVGLNFKDPKSSVLVLNSDQRYNCLVTSDPAPFKGALSSQLGKDQGR